MFDFILFAKSSGVEFDNEGNQKEGYLDLYQWCIAYVVIKHLLLLDSADIITAIARQSGKSQHQPKKPAYCRHHSGRH